MEKKKKLQLKKETVAVLNGQNMSNVIGGVGGPFDKCRNNIDCPPDYVCVQQDDMKICMQEASVSVVVSLITVSINRTISPGVATQKSGTCLTCKPGHQNTCGLCNP